MLTDNASFHNWMTTNLTLSVITLWNLSKQFFENVGRNPKLVLEIYIKNKNLQSSISVTGWLPSKSMTPRFGI